MEYLIRDFFTAYEKKFNEGLKDKVDVPAIAAAFADYFIEAHPGGVTGGKNDKAFIEQIPKGYEFYRAIGTRAMTIRDVEVTRIDELHYMAKVYWHSVYDKNEQEIIIDFAVVYLLQVRDKQPRIFAFIAGNERELLRQHGLVK